MDAKSSGAEAPSRKLSSIDSPSLCSTSTGPPSIDLSSPSVLHSLSPVTGTNDQKQSKKETSEPSFKELRYKLDESPGIGTLVLLGLQNFIILLGGTIAYSFILAPKMCIRDSDPARGYLVSTTLFCSGFSSLVQTYLGIRLPIIQGPSFTFLIPTLAVLTLPIWQCPEDVRTIKAYDDFLRSQSVTNSTLISKEYYQLWTSRMQEIQGAVIVASLVEVLIGATGFLGYILKFITPLSIAATISLIGLSLLKEATEAASHSWLVSGITISLVVLFSQYLVNYDFPLPCYSYERKKFHFERFKIFAMIPILLAVIVSWLLCWMLTVFNFYPENHPARTDLKVSQAVGGSSFIRIPTPFQWGFPTVTMSAVLGMTCGVVVSAIESIGDYYAASRLCDAPVPPKHAINRGIFVEGLSCVFAGIMGSGGGLTSYSENIGAIGITRTASRAAIAAASIIMVALSIFTKFSALCATIPIPIIGGLLMTMLSICTAVGLSYLQFVDLKSPRNLFILGSSIFFGLSIPTWIIANKDSIHTGSPAIDQIFYVLLSTGTLIGGFIGAFLDITIPATNLERGVNKMRISSLTVQQGPCDDHTHPTEYQLPGKLDKLIKRFSWMKYLPVCHTYTDGQEDDSPEKIVQQNDQLSRVTATKCSTASS